jgi:hypothetical protein
MAVRLQERLLGEILSIVVVTDPVIAVGVDVTHMRAVHLGEAGVQLGFGLGWVVGHRTASLPPVTLRG